MPRAYMPREVRLAFRAAKAEREATVEYCQQWHEYRNVYAVSSELLARKMPKAMEQQRKLTRVGTVKMTFSRWSSK